MEIKGILFDKDGTLIDFFDVWGKAVDPVMKELVRMYHLENNPYIEEKILKKIGVNGTKIDPEGSFAWKPYDLIATDIVEVMEEYGGLKEISIYELKKNLIRLFFEEIALKREHYPVFTDLEKMMNSLSQMNIKIGIATTDEKKSTKICMKKLHIEKWISFYGTAENNLPAKPDGELIRIAAKGWNILPEEIAVVGDTPNDMRFAKNGNSIGIAVLSGTGKKEDMEEIADYMIDSIHQIVPLLRTIQSKE